jgi:hypothetical protein
MTQVEKIEEEISKLSQEDVDALRQWFQKFDSAGWDRQIEEDATSGRLASLASEARAEYKAGDLRDLRSISRRADSGTATSDYLPPSRH